MSSLGGSCGGRLLSARDKGNVERASFASFVVDEGHGEQGGSISDPRVRLE